MRMVDTTTKKLCRGMKRPSRGVGTLIAAVFMVLILLFGFSIFFLMRSQADDYQKTVESMNRLDWERNQEKADIIFSWGSVSNLSLRVENTGNTTEIELALIGLFHKENRQPFGNTYTPIYEKDVLFKPGEIRTIGPYVFTPVVGEEEYIMQLITKRGNVISKTYSVFEEGYSGFFSLSGVGWVTVDLRRDAFLATTQKNITTPAWTINTADVQGLTFLVEFRNHADQDFKLLKWSYLELTEYGMTSVKAKPYYIVDNNSTYNNLVAYDEDVPVILPRPDCCGLETDCNLKNCEENDWIQGGNATYVKFAAAKPGTDEDQELDKSPASYNMAIMLYYEYKGEMIAQFIPFAGLRVID